MPEDKQVEYIKKIFLFKYIYIEERIKQAEKYICTLVNELNMIGNRNKEGKTLLLSVS